MDRKKFLRHCWSNLFKPLIYVIGLIFCVNFLVSSFLQSGTERLILLICLFLAIFYGILTLLRMVSKKINNSIDKRISKNEKNTLKKLENALGYASTVAFGGLIYFFYENQDWNAVTVLVVIFLGQLARIVKNEKQATIE